MKFIYICLIIVLFCICCGCTDKTPLQRDDELINFVAKDVKSHNEGNDLHNLVVTTQKPDGSYTNVGELTIKNNTWSKTYYITQKYFVIEDLKVSNIYTVTNHNRTINIKINPEDTVLTIGVVQ